MIVFIMYPKPRLSGKLKESLLQTYTHLVIGSCLGAALFPHQPLAQCACVVGAISPDLVMVPSYLLDKLQGRTPLGHQSVWLLFAKNVSHHVFLWGAMILLGYGTWWFASVLFACGIGGMSHIMTDVLTHGDSRFNEYDCRYLWPIQRRAFNIGRWDYRSGVGTLWPPKPVEGVVLLMCIGGTITFWIRSFLG